MGGGRVWALKIFSKRKRSDFSHKKIEVGKIGDRGVDLKRGYHLY